MTIEFRNNLSKTGNYFNYDSITLLGMTILHIFYMADSYVPNLADFKKLLNLFRVNNTFASEKIGHKGPAW